MGKPLSYASSQNVPRPSGSQGGVVKSYFPGQKGFVPAAEAEKRFAATVMLLRDGPTGLEVFMMERTATVDFGGLHVFPGGKVDFHDRAEDLEAHASGLTDVEASRRLGLESGGLAFWVAAVRECFEEAGVLLAYGPDGTVLRTEEPRWASALAELREEVNAGRLPFLELCKRFKLRLALDQVHYFSHWFTPEGPPRRYDTRFFVTAAPPQEGTHDDGELVGSRWVSPKAALAAWEAGEIQMIYPTHSTVRALATFEDRASALAAVARGAHRHLVTPDETLAREGLQAPPPLPTP